MIDLPSVNKTTNWNLYKGFDNISQSYPYRAFATGRRQSFLILLKTQNQDLDYLCGGASDGYRITFGLPNEWPQLWKRHFHVSLNEAALFKITPNVISTSLSIRDYDPNVRQCYFDTERELRFFKFYTQHNCELECFSNYSYSECGCVRFSMLSMNIHQQLLKELKVSIFKLNVSNFQGSKDMKICGPPKLHCILNAENSLYHSGAADLCNCLPSCETIGYDVEMSQNQFKFFNAVSRAKYYLPITFEKSVTNWREFIVKFDLIKMFFAF